MTPEELQRRTARYFVEDDHARSELLLEPGSGRAAAVWTFLHDRAAEVRVSDLWDPVEEEVVSGETEADPGARVDAGRAVGLVAEFTGIVHDGVPLPDVSLIGSPLTIFWAAGPSWDHPDRVVAFFDLLRRLERDCGVRPVFAATDDQVRVGPQFAEIYRSWGAGGG